MLNKNLLPMSDDRVRLRPMHDGDAEPYAAGSADPAVRAFAHLPEPEYSAASVRDMIATTAAPMLERGELAVLSIADAESDEFLGSLVVFDITAEAAEVGFWVHPNARGAGVANRALALAADFARASGLDRLTARTVSANRASQAVLAAAGMTRTAIGNDLAPDGARVEMVTYVRSL